MQMWRPVPSPWVLGDLCEVLGMPLSVNDAAVRPLEGVLPLDEAGPAHVSFLDNPRYVEMARQTKAAAVFVKPELAGLLPQGCVPLVTPAPYVAFAKALALFYPPVVEGGIHPTAVVDDTAFVSPTAAIGPGVVIGPGVEIGDGTVVGPHCVIRKASIGARCLLHPHVCIGQDGFGFAQGKGEIIKVPQVGGVLIGDDVEIGAGTTIDCGALGDTVIGSGVKIDNQVQIGHNVKIGPNCRLVAQVGIAGSTTLGAWCVVGGQSAIVGHLHIADGVQIAARSGVTKSIGVPGAVVAGLPAEPIREWRKKMALLARMVKRSRPARDEGGE